MMVQQSKQTFLFLVVVLSLFYEAQSGVFVVYPLGVGGDIVNLPKPKFSSRKLDSGDSNERNSFNKTHLHLIYPVNEELIIMTPSPMEEIKERKFEFTESPQLFDGETNEFMTTTSIPDVTTELDAFRIDFDSDTTDSDDLDSATEGSGDPSPSDILIDTTTDAITTEISIPKAKANESHSNSLPIYDTTGPIKLLRKRMFEFKKYVPSSQIKLPTSTKNSNIKPTPTTQRTIYRKRYFTTAVPSAKMEASSSPKHIIDETKMDKNVDKKKELKRYTYKRWFTPPKKTDDGRSIDSSTSKQEEPKTVEQEDIAENRQ